MFRQTGKPFGPRRSAAGFALAVVLAVVTAIAGAVVDDWRAGASTDAAPRARGTPCLLLVEASCTPQPIAVGSE